jgi:hypothetical protein
MSNKLVEHEQHCCLTLQRSQQWNDSGNWSRGAVQKAACGFPGESRGDGFGHRLRIRSTSDSPTATAGFRVPQSKGQSPVRGMPRYLSVRAFVWSSSNTVPHLTHHAILFPGKIPSMSICPHCKTQKLTLRDRGDPRTLQWRSWGARRTGLQRSAIDGTNRTPPEATLAQLWSCRGVYLHAAGRPTK